MNVSNDRGLLPLNLASQDLNQVDPSQRGPGSDPVGPEEQESFCREQLSRWLSQGQRR